MFVDTINGYVYGIPSTETIFGAQIGEPQRVIISEPVFEPVPVREPVNEPQPAVPEPVEVPTEG